MPDEADKVAAEKTEVALGPLNIKGLAHPLRVRLLGALRLGGPATASGLARLLGESSGATSYHLRQLEKFGFVVETEGGTSQKERWWRAAHQDTRFDVDSLLGKAETKAAGLEFLRTIAAASFKRMSEWIDELPSLSAEWQGAGTMSDWALRLDADELRSLSAEIEALIGHYHRFNPEEPGKPGSTIVGVQLQLLPKATS
ncbi:MAG: helix-turn-helix domain-containing protein [Treponema sp.]|nr:helix-turn-helix domain-containing protein [Treponema sp.]